MTKSKGMNIRWNFEEAKVLFLEYGYNLIPTQKVNVVLKLIAINNEDYKINISINKLRLGREPSIFYNNPFGIENLNLYFKKYNINSIILDEEIKNSSQKMKFQCECGNFFQKSISDIEKTKTCRCKECRYGVTRKIFQEDFNVIKQYVEIESASDCKLLSKEYINNATYMEFKCKCGSEFSTTFAKFKDRNQRQCQKCGRIASGVKGSLSRTKTQEEFELEIYNLVNNEYKVVSKYLGAMKPISFLHEKCGKEWTTTYNSFHTGGRCPICTSSKGEKVIRDLLLNNHINFYEQYKIVECRDKSPLPFDFSIFEDKEKTRLKCLIEYDGEQHFKSMSYFGGEERFNDQQKKDNIKNDYCKQNNIELLRIPYWGFENIETILESVLP